LARTASCSARPLPRSRPRVGSSTSAGCPLTRLAATSSPRSICSSIKCSSSASSASRRSCGRLVASAASLGVGPVVFSMRRGTAASLLPCAPSRRLGARRAHARCGRKGGAAGTRSAVADALAPVGGCRIKPFERTRSTLAEVHLRAAVHEPSRRTACVRRTRWPFSEPTLTSDPAGSPRVFPTATSRRSTPTLRSRMSSFAVASGALAETRWGPYGLPPHHLLLR
jgi:hypothetical protein